MQKQDSPIKSDNIVDYPFIDDLYDIWLFANCDLVITTGSGPDVISSSYGIPSIFIYYSPLAFAPSWSPCVCSPKCLFWKTNNLQLTLKEYVANTYFKSEEYENAGIYIKGIEPAEILEIVKSSIDFFWQSKDNQDKIPKQLVEDLCKIIGE